MNDPHVKALHYRLFFGDDIDYDKAPPVKEITPEFTMGVGSKQAVFTMHQHFATEKEARKVVEEYIRAWEILAGLQHDPDDLRLTFDRAYIIDRSPEKNVVSMQAHACAHSHTSDDVTLHSSYNAFPDRPKGFIATPDAAMLYQRYKDYREGREKLTAMGYMCLTVLEAAAARRNKAAKPYRKEAAKQYRIEEDVLKILGNLTSTKGGPEEARKAQGSHNAMRFLPEEQEWIVEAIKAIIKRVGEWNQNVAGGLPMITMGDLPPLITGSNT